MGLISDVGRGAVAIDTAVFIYFIEEDPRFVNAGAGTIHGNLAVRHPGATGTH